MLPKFGGGHSLKRYAAPELPFAWKQNIISSAYTELHVELNKWHSTIEKLNRKRTET